MRTFFHCILCFIFFNVFYGLVTSKPPNPNLTKFLKDNIYPVKGYKNPWPIHEASPKYSLACAKGCYLQFLFAFDHLTEGKCLEGKINTFLLRDLPQTMDSNYIRKQTLSLKKGSTKMKLYNNKLTETSIDFPDDSFTLNFSHIFLTGQKNGLGEIIYDFEMKIMNLFGGKAAKEYELCFQSTNKQFKEQSKFHGFIKMLENSLALCGAPVKYLAVDLQKSVNRYLDEDNVASSDLIGPTEELGFLEFIKDNLYLIHKYQDSIYEINDEEYSLKCLQQCLISFFNNIKTLFEIDCPNADNIVTNIDEFTIKKEYSKLIYVSDSIFEEKWNTLNNLAVKAMVEIHSYLQETGGLQDNMAKFELFGNILMFENTFIKCGAPLELTALNIKDTFKSVDDE